MFLVPLNQLYHMEFDFGMRHFSASIVDAFRLDWNTFTRYIPLSIQFNFTMYWSGFTA